MVSGRLRREADDTLYDGVGPGAILLEGRQMLATLNRWFGAALIAVGFMIAGAGVFFGAFGWLNDGPVVGLKLLGLCGAFGAGLSIAGFALRFAGAAHGRRDPRRWWIQLLAVALGYGAVGLAAWASALLDRIGR